MFHLTKDAFFFSPKPFLPCKNLETRGLFASFATPGAFNSTNCYPFGVPQPPQGRGPAASVSSTYGGAFTPKGDIKVLVIFAGFTDNVASSNINYCDDQDGRWPNSYGAVRGTTLPANLSDVCYTANAQFSLGATDQTMSNFCYQMSRTAASPLRMTFGYFPQRINVPSTGRNYGDILGYGQDVLNAIATNPAYANFDWSPYDQHLNDPNFTSDNSTTGPDGVLDYVVICFRSSRCGLPSQPGPNNTTIYLNGLPGGTGIAGVPSVTFPATATRRAYRIATGHSQADMTFDRSACLHEFAHTLFYAPHVFGANGVTGPYLAATLGWSMMQSISTLFASNAWERWYLGWTELRTGAAQVSSDVQNAASLTPTNGIYTLRDYTTTGDVMRIRIPNTTQYLWLENHVGPGPCDRRTWVTGGDGVNFLPPPNGLLAMVEDMAERTSFISSSKISGLRTVSAEGNFDYQVLNPTPSLLNYHIWNNRWYNFSGPVSSAAPEPNASGSYNQASVMRFDANNDGRIPFDAHDGNATATVGNEGGLIVSVTNTITDGLLGPDLGKGTRQVGFRYSLDSNPLITPHLRFDAATETLAEIPLNGLSVQVTAYDAPTGAITVKVRYDNTAILRNTRWTGTLRTYPVTNATQGAALYVESGALLTLARSGTMQRVSRSAQNDFANDTRLTIGTGTSLRLASAAYVELRGAGTTLYLEPKASASAGGGGRFRVFSGAKISVQNRADIGGTIVLDAGARLEVRSGATIYGPVTL